MNWYHRVEQRYVEYGSSFEATRAFGLFRATYDIVYNMNMAHLSSEVETVFESLGDIGVRTACTPFLIYRGRTRHELGLEGLLRRGAVAAGFRHAVWGPDELFYGELFSSRPVPCKPTLARPGTRDEYSACVSKELVADDAYDFLLFSLPDNDHHTHRVGPGEHGGLDRPRRRLLRRAGRGGRRHRRVPRDPRRDPDGRPRPDRGRPSRYAIADVLGREVAGPPALQRLARRRPSSRSARQPARRPSTCSADDRAGSIPTPASARRSPGWTGPTCSPGFATETAMRSSEATRAHPPAARPDGNVRAVVRRGAAELSFRPGSRGARPPRRRLGRSTAISPRSTLERGEDGGDRQRRLPRRARAPVVGPDRSARGRRARQPRRGLGLRRLGRHLARRRRQPRLAARGRQPRPAAARRIRARRQAAPRAVAPLRRRRPGPRALRRGRLARRSCSASPARQADGPPEGAGRSHPGRVAPRFATPGRAGRIATWAAARSVHLGTRKPGNWVQLFKFGVVGGSGYAINLVAFALLNGSADLGHISAAIGAFMVAVTNNFAWNRIWTFRAEAPGSAPGAPGDAIPRSSRSAAC